MFLLASLSAAPKNKSGMRVKWITPLVPTKSTPRFVKRASDLGIDWRSSGKGK